MTGFPVFLTVVLVVRNQAREVEPLVEQVIPFTIKFYFHTAGYKPSPLGGISFSAPPFKGSALACLLFPHGRV